MVIEIPGSSFLCRLISKRNLRRLTWIMLLPVLSVMDSSAQERVEFQSEIIDTVEIKVSALPNYNIVYPVLYQMQQEKRVTGAIGYLKGDKLRSTPSAFISNAFTGRIAGLFTRQLSGEPGNDGVNVFVRGVQPLVLVDGVVRSIYSIDPEEIESVSVLKDAVSTAMLGMRSMNGALLITTRKQGKSPGFHLNLTAQSGVSSPVRLPKPLSAYDYGRLYNEALANDNKAPIYSQADLEAYHHQTDIYGHPDINWYDQVLRNQAPFSRYSLNAAGSTNAVRYFVSLDYMNQKGLLKESPLNTYSTNTAYNRYIFRSNVDVDLTSRLSLSLNLFGRIQNQNNPQSNMGAFFTAIRNTPNNAYPVINPNGSLGGNINYSNNIHGQSVLSGYQKNILSDTYADLALKRSMDDVLKGWWVKAQLSYNIAMVQQIVRTKNFETFQMKIDPATSDTTYDIYGTKTDQSNTSTVSGLNHQFYAEASTGYDRNWGNNALQVLLLVNSDSYRNRSDLPNKYQSVSGRISYSIQDKYVFEATSSYSGNNRYQPGNRFGLFPAAGVSWILNNEDFFNKDGFLNTMKLRASYGLTGNAVAGYYDYIDRYAGATGYYFGTSVSSASGRAYRQPAAVHTWEKALKLNVGMDLSFAGGRGMISADYYRNKLQDLVQSRGMSSALIGWGDNIVQNIGSNRYAGLEITAGWANQAGAFDYYISGNFSLNNSTVLYNDEPAYPYEWMQRTGQRVGQTYGYVADGFVTQAGQGPVVEGYQSLPGDIKYKDLNGDGVINQFDQQAIGSTAPLMFFGTDIGLSWKKFSLSLLIQGVANENLSLTGANHWEFQNDGKGQAYHHHLTRWSQETAASATYPRLTVGTNVNNHVNSSFWIRRGDYVRLKNAELAYTFNNMNLGKAKLKQLRVFVNGLNLLTFSGYTLTDPETFADVYPIQRAVNGGIALGF